MKTLYTIILVSLATTVLAQESVLFRVEFKPGKVYVTEINMLMDGTMSFDGEPGMMEDLAESGMAGPITMKGTNSIVITSETGAMTDDGLIPVRIEYTKAHSYMEAMSQIVDQEGPLAGMVVYGKYNQNMYLEVDSVANSKLSPEEMDAFMEALREAQGMVDFPDVPMKEGDIFTQKMPLTIPISGMVPVEMEIESVYILKNITDGIARFDIDQKLKMDMDNSSVVMTANANGRGSCEFDISNSQLTGNEITMDIGMRMDMGGIYMIFSYKTDTSYKVTIK